MAWYYAANRGEVEHNDFPSHDPLLGAAITPSQKAVLKYFWIVSASIYTANNSWCYNRPLWC